MSKGIIVEQVLMAAETITKAATAYTDSRRFSDCDGSACCLIKSTAGSITVTQQCSHNGVDWFDPENSTGAVGAVEDTITVTTGRYLVFTPVLTPFIRFKVVEGNVADAVVTITLIYRAEV
jgi:hypothetical protein